MLNTFTCIIIDDEEDAIGMLQETLRALYNNVYVTASYRSWQDGLHAMRAQNADIIFLDISLDGRSGMELLSYVPSIESEVIFVTAYSEYALDAFRFSATGYLVKPIKDEELIVAVDKAIERIKHKRLSAIANESGSAQVSKIGIPSSTGIDYVNVRDIMYFEAQKGYTKVITTGGEILTSYRIGKFKSILESHFFQVHRSFIVNLEHIARYNSSGMLVMRNKYEIPVARNLRDEFLRLFNTVSGRGSEGDE